MKSQAGMMGIHELRHWEQISPICQVELQPQPVFNLSPANSVTLSKLFNLSDSVSLSVKFADLYPSLQTGEKLNEIIYKKHVVMLNI